MSTSTQQSGSSTRPPQPDKPCAYRLDDDSSATLDLPDGRKLAYAQWGALDGEPIIYNHGFPGSRVEAAALDNVGNKVGARIIAIDRPGFGNSTPHPTRTLQGYAQDVEALTKHLQLPRYGVLGISGGGPYTLACARFLPADKLRAASIVCGLGPPDLGYRGMKMMNYLGWTYGQRLFPSLCRWWFSREPAYQLQLSDEERMRQVRTAFEKGKPSMDPRDADFFGDENQMRLFLRTSREVVKQGMDGFATDFKVLNADFGFKVEDIRKDLPVHVWHGTSDEFVPTRHGEKVAERLGANARLTLTDDTHASISKTQKEAYLRDLVKAIKGE